MLEPQIDFDAIDPNKVDLDFQLRHLSREMIFTVRLNDDKLFKLASEESQKIFDQIVQELISFRKDYNQRT